MPGAAVMQWLVRGGGRCAAWLSSVRSTTGEGDREAPPVGADADFDFTDFDHREFVSAGVAAGIAVRVSLLSHAASLGIGILDRVAANHAYETTVRNGRVNRCRHQYTA